MILKIYMVNSRNISVDVLLNSPFISPLEKLSFEKYKNEQVKKEKIASSILKNKYVGEYHIDEYGKPISENIYFNISHSDYLVALVISDVPVGIDIERIREVDQDLKNYVTDEEEKKYVKDNKSFFEIWTNKEAVVKAYGTGIDSKPDKISSLPINGKREYKGKVYFNKTVEYLDYIVTTSRQKEEDYSLEIIEEVI